MINSSQHKFSSYEHLTCDDITTEKWKCMNKSIYYDIIIITRPWRFFAKKIVHFMLCSNALHWLDYAFKNCLLHSWYASLHDIHEHAVVLWPMRLAPYFF